MAADIHGSRPDDAARNLLVASCAGLVLLIVASLYVWKHMQGQPHPRPAIPSVTNAPAAPHHEKPSPTTGRLTVTSDPSGAQVWLLGRYAGVTPTAVDAVDEGAVTVVLRKEGYKSATIEANVRRGETAPVRARLDKIEGPVPTKAWTVPNLGLAMAWMPPGSFIMGSADGDTNGIPAHQVAISNGFWIGVYEVTQAQWELAMETRTETIEGRKHPEFPGTNRPVENVTWFECVDFCKKLTEQEREASRLPDELEYRLPTEAEWEYACRAGTQTAFCYGDTLDTSKANFDGRHPVGDAPAGVYRKATMPVGSFPPNAWGLYDMHGNVYEWCAELFVGQAEAGRKGSVERFDDPLRVARGGSWYDYGDCCRSAHRSGVNSGYAFSDVGMRLVLGTPQIHGDKRQ